MQKFACYSKSIREIHKISSGQPASLTRAGIRCPRVTLSRLASVALPRNS
ncbi:uncharacterized protein CTRU02_204122 [Colletotrichum truncatum]|uniref:Uncharacterized protein n=1 Tax=Colletotrichum truncatum TaxID=5467 RepID=A0ACC3ZB78_COLTU|nr:uncharacterized protein CTRU02_09975 [Colletotrichum truncatum]KAF6787680.1 hypothetical protein CTRU02_09975 [Colletotrichum truncatum]